jgi:hypoxanthine phosphoribosyltransferase
MTRADPSAPLPAQTETLRCLISAEDLARRVGELARQISADHAGRPLVLVGVLKGAWVFLADLARRLTVPAKFDFVKLASYGGGTNTSGQVQLHLDHTSPLAGQDVVIVEDIVDTGTTCRWLIDHLRQQGATRVRLCALLDNPARRVEPIRIDYLGFTIPNRFVVGYGIDLDERYRYLPYVGYLAPGDDP